MTAPGIFNIGGVQGPPGATGPAGATGAAGANGHGATTTTGIGGSVVTWGVFVADGTAFNIGNWLYVTDGTNSIFGQISSGGGTTSLIVDTTNGAVTGNPLLIPNGTVVTWRGQRGATGATGPTGPTGPQGPSGIASPADVQVLASPIGGLGTTMTDILTSAGITIGAGGKVLIQVYFSVTVTTANFGVHYQVKNNTDNVIVVPKNEGGINQQALNPSTAGSACFMVQGYQTGLTAGSSKVYKFQADDAIGVSGTTDIADATMAIWTW